MKYAKLENFIAHAGRAAAVKNWPARRCQHNGVSRLHHRTGLNFIRMFYYLSLSLSFLLSLLPGYDNVDVTENVSNTISTWQRRLIAPATSSSAEDDVIPPYQDFLKIAANIIISSWILWGAISTWPGLGATCSLPSYTRLYTLLHFVPLFFTTSAALSIICGSQLLCLISKTIVCLGRCHG